MNVHSPKVEIEFESDKWTDVSEFATKRALKEVVVYSAGLVCCSACAPADMAVADVEASVNRQHPTGIASSWTVADEPFADGTPNPSPCNDGPLKKHYLLTC